MYMIERAKNLAQEKRVYSEPEAYIGHCFATSMKKKTLDSYSATSKTSRKTGFTG